MIDRITLNVDYCKPTWTAHNVEFNASWLTITPAHWAPGYSTIEDTNVYCRGANDPDWYDEVHQRVVNAKRELDNALEALVKHDRAKRLMQEAAGIAPSVVNVGIDACPTKR